MAKCPFPAVLAVLTGLLSCSPVLGKYGSYYSQRQMASRNVDFYGLEATICRTTPGLTRKQIKVCEHEPDTAAVALQGLAKAAKECQFQFHDHRWNCSALSKPRNLYTSDILKRGFKETAFVYALSAAGLVIEVAKACASNSLNNCNCDSRKYKMQLMHPKETESFLKAYESFKWGGCSHNLKYGVSFSKRFLDSRESFDDIYSTINLNNNKVGIKAVKNNMQLRCKCHGLSGSCQMKTCWREVPDMRKVGAALMEKFKRAMMFKQDNLGSRNPKKMLKKMMNKKRKKELRLSKEWDLKTTRVKKELDLVYYENSPNFCEKDQHLGILGTSGRFCNESNHSRPDSCSVLCCGRGHNMIFSKRNFECNCKFIWCCTVKCEICDGSKWVGVCK